MLDILNEYDNLDTWIDYNPEQAGNKSTLEDSLVTYSQKTIPTNESNNITGKLQVASKYIMIILTITAICDTIKALQSIVHTILENQITLSSRIQRIEDTIKGNNCMIIVNHYFSILIATNFYSLLLCTYSCFKSFFR